MSCDLNISVSYQVSWLMSSKKGVKFYILEADANLAIGVVWANHGDHAEIFMLDGLNELKDLVVSRDENIAFLEVSLILNFHVYNIAYKPRKVKKSFQLFSCTIQLQLCCKVGTESVFIIA